MRYIEISQEDALKTFYFIVALTQNQGSSSMQGALSSKGDLIGGIFDRWINLLPESVVFNKCILPNVANGNKVEVISDFYLYDPKTSGIAPDVIGIRVNGHTVPFAVYDQKWVPVPNTPQIEVKTFKRNQKMISLRDQGYSNKFLVMTETDLRIDYLLPFFNQVYFCSDIYQQMTMDDSVFLKSNNGISGIKKIDFSKDTLGSVSLLKITDASTFMQVSNLCGAGESPQYINSISAGRLTGGILEIPLPLSYYCFLNNNGLYEFNSNWYSNIFKIKGIKTLNFWSSGIDSIYIHKINKTSIYIISQNDTCINDFAICKNIPYKIDFQILDRSGSKGEEYFFSKSIVKAIPDKEKDLNLWLEMIIKNNA